MNMTLVVGSVKVASALFERRSSIYSNRIGATLYHLKPWGHVLGAGREDGFTGATGDPEGHLTMLVLLRPQTTHWVLIISRFSAALIMAVTYGYKVITRDGPWALLNSLKRTTLRDPVFEILSRRHPPPERFPMRFKEQRIPPLTTHTGLRARGERRVQERGIAGLRRVDLWFNDKEDPPPPNERPPKKAGLE
ncbi:hypothetical protein BV22DRAFT_1183059 [Leucogyrophana mollusca]|uniref:Uncharacterized protein n=1 Tax=Leucogyrophana mollusca TaxID=85980 RepID=A0ACB8B513_9AGAM|nr:hypothetical protein BV22DRAFT_1183059 [Leucogyrophana mollusca]